ncbi:MAG: hypothetical protein ACR2NW_05480, partial [Thermodesulfobacteriota bacterium]
LKLFRTVPDPGFDRSAGEFIVEFPDNEVTPNGEKGIGGPLVLNRLLIFTTFAPDPSNDNPCTAAFGEGRLFALDFLTGDPAIVRIPGIDGDLLKDLDAADSAATAGLKAAEGIPSAANITFGTRGSAILTVAFSGSPATGGAQFYVLELPPTPARSQTLFWEEIL